MSLQALDDIRNRRMLLEIEKSDLIKHIIDALINLDPNYFDDKEDMAYQVSQISLELKGLIN